MSNPLHPPMELGQVLDGTDDQSNLMHADKLGLMYRFFSFSPTGNQRGGKARPAGGRQITAVLLRNTSGLTLLGKRFGLLDTTAGYGGIWNVVGYTSGLAEKNLVLIDPWLPSTGVVANDLFWGIVAGPAEVLLPLTGAGMSGDIAVGNRLMATTGTTTGVTTSGRIGNVTIANVTAAQGAADSALACVGRALSARTTGETTAGLGILVDLSIQTFR